MVCPFHSDEWSTGVKQDDGTVAHTCTRPNHPGGLDWSWLEVPPAPSGGLSGLAEELGLATRLPEVVGALGSGWFEYGLVEREYARQDPAGFARMVEQWQHTALGDQQYSASSYLAGTLGRLSARGALAYHPGRGTGRWSYNASISWWATTAGPWEARTSWADVVGNHRDPDPCWQYVPGSPPA